MNKSLYEIQNNRPKLDGTHIMDPLEVYKMNFMISVLDYLDYIARNTPEIVQKEEYRDQSGYF